MRISSRDIVLNNLKNILKVYKIDGLTFAKKVGWKSAKYYHKINGKRQINLNDIDDIVKALRIKPENLLKNNFTIIKRKK